MDKQSVDFFPLPVFGVGIGINFPKRITVISCFQQCPLLDQDKRRIRIGRMQDNAFDMWVMRRRNKGPLFGTGDVAQC